jgi:hypothetical protein
VTIKRPVRSSQKTHYALVAEAVRLTLREVNAACFEDRAKFCGHYVVVSMLKQAVGLNVATTVLFYSSE